VQHILVAVVAVVAQMDQMQSVDLGWRAVHTAVVAVALLALVQMRLVMAQLVQFVLFGLVIHDHFHQLIQVICNESLHSN
jgi:hypothetical protein